MKLGRESLPWHCEVRAINAAWDYSRARTPELCEACGLLIVAGGAPGACACDECSHCDDPVPAGQGERADGYVFCDDGCRDAYAEAAWDRWCSDYYGGSSPQTDAERREVAARTEPR